MSSVKNVIGPQLRSLRKARKITQDMLVARLHTQGLDHLNRVSISKIESQIRNVTDYELQIIAEVIQVSADDLLPAYDVALNLAKRIGSR